MKTLLTLAFAILASAAPIFAQTPVLLSKPSDWGPWKGLTTATGNAQRCVDLSGQVINDHSFSYQPNNGPIAITITITGMRAGTQSTITTGTTTTGGTIHFTGVYNTLCFVVTTLTGAGASVDGGYDGINAAAATSGAVTVTSGSIDIANIPHVIVDSGGGGGSTAQGAAIAGVTGGLNMVSTTTAAPTYTNATVNPLNGQTDGSLRVANTAALPAGNNNVGDVDVASIAAGSNIIGNVRIDQTTPGTTNGVVLGAETTKVIGTVRTASGGVASGSFASGALASGSIASGAVASGAVASGAFAAGSISDGADVTLGAKADAKSTATDTTAITLMQVAKQISASVQAIAALASTDPCTGTAKQFFTIDITTGTTTEITPSLSGASNYWYICSINIVTTAANNVNLVDDNTDGCGSVTASLISTGLAAGDGWGFGANGGLALGSGNGTILKSATTNSVLCLVTSAASELHGTIGAVPAP